MRTNKKDLVAALAEVGADVFIARRALDEVERRIHQATVRRLSAAFAADEWTIKDPPSEWKLAIPACLEVDRDTFVAWRSATKRDLIAAANYTAGRYLARRERRQRLLDTFFAAVMLAPKLDEGQTVGEVWPA